jgi:hypothetical protein
VGVDFDLAVLAVGPGAVPHLCRDLIARLPRWKEMADNLKSVPTQAFQIWLRTDMKALGWHEAPINISGFVNPFDTWADMTHLAPVESWPRAPRAIAYFCSVLPDARPRRRPTPGTRRRGGRRCAPTPSASSIATSSTCGRPALEGGRFRWDLLLGPGDGPEPPPAAGRGALRHPVLDRQRQPHRPLRPLPAGHPSAPPLAARQHRRQPDRGGDWTDSGFNEGCVEAAAMSGRLAAHALTGSPALADIPGYDHP